MNATNQKQITTELSQRIGWLKIYWTKNPMILKTLCHKFLNGCANYCGNKSAMNALQLMLFHWKKLHLCRIQLAISSHQQQNISSVDRDVFCVPRHESKFLSQINISQKSKLMIPIKKNSRQHPDCKFSILSACLVIP